MAEDDGVFVPQGKRIDEKLVKTIDKLYWDPQERAMGVLAILESVREKLKEENKRKGRPEGADVPSQWDILCFAIEHMAAMSITMEDEDLEKIARSAASWLYSTHYSFASKIYGAPDRERGKKGEEKEE